jgi:cytochrome c-type protein NapB
VSDERPLALRLARIAAAAVLMVAVVLALGMAASADPDEARRPTPPTGAPVPEEADVFRLAPGATTLAMDAERRPDARVRDLDAYYALRAYPGAPPAIPHDVEPAWLRTQACNTCHARGGWVPDQRAYAPVTPHPQYRNCMQCHVDGADGALFVPNDFRPAPRPAIDQQALDGSPPPIPHALQLRGNCLACHAGPAAVAEVRTTHPERANCRQCHAARDDVGTARGASAGAVPTDAFTRGVR